MYVPSLETLMLLASSLLCHLVLQSLRKLLVIALLQLIVVRVQGFHVVA
jgi:hypothetical protein